MFWKRNNKEQQGPRLAGPKDIPEVVKKYLASNPIIDAGIVPFLKSVVKHNEKGVNDIFIFDPSDVEARNIKVENYDTLKQNPDLIIAEGSFDESAKTVQLTPKKAISKIKFFTYEEILQQIQALKEPGSSVFFFTNAGSGAGGPLGRGAALIKLNAAGDGKKVKKYGVFGVSIINLQPAQDESKIFDADKPEQIAKWVADSHKTRFC